MRVAVTTGREVAAPVVCTACCTLIVLSLSSCAEVIVRAPFAVGIFLLVSFSANVTWVEIRASAEISLGLVFKFVVAVAPRVVGIEVSVVGFLAETITFVFADIEAFAGCLKVAFKLLVAVAEGVV